MLNGLTAFYHAHRLNNSSNPVIANIRKQNWLVLPESSRQVSLFQDMLTDTVKIRDERFFFSEEFHEFRLSLNQTLLAETTALEKYLARMLPLATSHPDYPAQLVALKQHWHAGLTKISHAMIARSLRGAPPDTGEYVVKANCESNLSFERGKFVLTSKLTDISVEVHPIGVPKYLAGGITAYYELTNDGFRLSRVNASTSLLQDCCYTKQRITSHKELIEQEKERELDDKLAALELDISLCKPDDPRIKPAKELVAEIKRLKSLRLKTITRQELETIIYITQEIITNNPDKTEILQYQQRAREFGKHPFGLRLVKAMLALAGAALLAGGITLAVMSVGGSLPIAGPIIASGFMTMVLGGSLFADSFRKSQLQMRMTSLGCAAFQMTNPYHARPM